ncbi:MAG: O-antigen ligase family protein [Bacteroidota bacterium]|nr:O-antigen ligase family protein [Bacteroidota bacterium]
MNLTNSFNSKLKWFYIISIAFIGLNAVLIAFDFYWLNLLPAIALIIYLALFSTTELLLFVVFCTPLAITLKDYDIDIGLSLPTEPILFGLTLIFLFKIIYDNSFNLRIFKHPVSISIYFYLAWMLVTSLTSTLPVVSIKFLISKLWFIIPFYFIANEIFINNKKNIKIYTWLYMISLMIVIIYTISRHAGFNFAQKQAHWVMDPFYNDHTAYGVVLAMFVPILTGFSFSSTTSRNIKIISLIFLIIYLFATVLSYTRAAWLSIAVALIVYLILLFKIKLRTILISFGSFLALFLMFHNEISIIMGRNKQDSATNYFKHLKSMYNVSTDASNKERLNRWDCAIKMFCEKPVFGWGPGTYQFKYAPFQEKKYETIISTNAGNRGNAHSEYLGPLSESGLLGTLSFLAIIFSVIYTSVKTYKNSNNKEYKFLTLIFLLSLITYFVHGFLNNFLDTDKASAPFWGFIAAIVAIDIADKKERNLL